MYASQVQMNWSQAQTARVRGCTCIQECLHCQVRRRHMTTASTPSEDDQESESSQAAKPPTSTNSTKEVNLTPCACNAAQGQAQNGKRLTKYAINGMDPDRIQLCLALDKRICGPTCRKSCGSQFTVKEVQAVCNVCPPRYRYFLTHRINATAAFQ